MLGCGRQLAHAAAPPAAGRGEQLTLTCLFWTAQSQPSCRPPPPWQVAEALHRLVETEGLLPPLPPAQEGGEPQPRTMECLTPKKSLKVWNPK